MSELTVNPFRRARGRILRRQIDQLAAHLGRDITVLDVGGRAEYWDNVGVGSIARIILLNNDVSELARPAADGPFVPQLGDARDLSAFADNSIDLAHSNSVIEHVGLWPDMQAMAGELRRVGRSGWVQTPAWEFPVEPHYRLPILHWLAPPARRVLLRFSPDYGRLPIDRKRYHIERINLLSRKEFESLFPDCSIYVERLLFPKSFVARWFPGQILDADRLVPPALDQVATPGGDG